MATHPNPMVAATAALLATLAEHGEARTGPMYAVLNGAGITLNDFNVIQATLVSRDLCTLDGTLLRITPAGRAFAADLGLA